MDKIISFTASDKANAAIERWFQNNPELACKVKPRGIREMLNGRGDPVVRILTTNKYGPRIHWLQL